MTFVPASPNDGHVTVADLLAMSVFESCELIEAGEDQLTQVAVTGVTITAPPFGEFARRGEIVMCTGDDIGGQEPGALHAELLEIGVAGLVLSFSDSAALLQWRQRWPRPSRIPLFVYPWHRRFADLTRAIDDAVALANEQDGLFANMVHEGRGVQDLLDALEQAICAPVLLLDHAGYPVGRGRTSYRYDDNTFALMTDTDGRPAMLPAARTPIEWSPNAGPLPSGALIGIATRQDPYAYLHAGLESALNRTTRQRLIDAAAAIAIESLRHRSTRQTERLLAEAALWNLVQSPASPGADDDLRRLVAWGLAATRQHHVAAAVPPRSASSDAFEHAVSEIRRVCLERYPNSVVATGPEGVLVVLPEELKAGDDIVGLTGDVLAWGVGGEAVDLRSLPSTARTALRTARAALLHHGPGGVSAPEEMRPWSMIVDITESDDAREQADRMVAALESAAGDLVYTVRILIEENCNVSAASRRLFLNRHSLLYRIERIEQLTGTSLRSPTDRLLLQLCLIVHDSNRPPASG